MKDITVSITENTSGKYLRDILRRDLNISASLLSKLKKNNGILLNGKSVTVAEKVQKGDILNLLFPQEKSETIEAVNLPLDIIYEDSCLLAVNKPKDMPTHPSVGNRNNTLANACMYYYKDTDFVFRPVNRLDRDTTGIIIIAKDAHTSAIMSKYMQEGKFKKTYYAITDGIPSQDNGIIDAPIGRANESIIKREVREDGQKAVTEYKVIKKIENKSLVEVKLHTGRTHQIRVHFAHIGTPLLYDYMYGTEISGETLYLHCGKITFPHPVSGEELTINAKYFFPFFDI